MGVGIGLSNLPKNLRTVRYVFDWLTALTMSNALTQNHNVPGSPVVYWLTFQVTAIDIFPMLVVDQPENLTLFGYNLNDRLRDPEVFQSRAYDLIHSRFVSQGIRASRWPSYMSDMRLLLRPGGWVQIMEYLPIIQSDSGRLSEEAAIRRWWQYYEGSMRRLNRDPRIGRRLQQILTEKGFRDVQVDVERLPIGSWHPGQSICIFATRAFPECCMSLLGRD